MKQQIHTFGGRDGLALDYLLYLPPSYEDLTEWPFILYLHGVGERGSDPRRLLAQPLPSLLETDDLPFVVVSPQCPAGESWSSYLEPVEQLLDDVVARYRADRSRLYLTGLSMGGYGTWALALSQPERFAAIVPICGGWPGGGSIDERICALKDLPIWAFHGAQDDVVPVEETIALIDALRECGATPRMTIYPDLKHNSWTETYSNEGLYHWFLEHARLDD